MNTSQLATLGFLCLFSLIGGIAIGSTLRGWLHGGGFACNSLFFLVWGGIFGGVPVVIGAGTYLKSDMPYLFGVQVLVLLGAIAVTALISPSYLQSISSPETTSIAMGGLFMLIGLGVGVLMLSREDWFPALLFGGSFGGTGLLVFIKGLRDLMNKK